jgi:hypothetical protein
LNQGELDTQITRSFSGIKSKNFMNNLSRQKKICTFLWDEILSKIYKNCPKQLYEMLEKI